MNALNPVRSVGDQIGEAIRRHEPGVARDAVAHRVAELLDMVGLGPERGRQLPHQFSGGMRQRAGLAMALACRPKLLCADEPTTALDLVVQAQILELLSRLGQELGLAVLLVTHDLGVVAEVCDAALVMYAGLEVESAAVADLFGRPQHPYTQGLLRAFPDRSAPGAVARSIPGSPPRLDQPLPACRFAPRCPVAFDRCRHEPPGLHPAGPGHRVRCHLAEGASR
jgi:oligopeptide/dipeptide ABC transporter ATP-binding protein